MHRLSFPRVIAPSWLILTTILVVAAGHAASSVWASEPDSEEQGEVSDKVDEASHPTDDTSDDDDYPWLVLPVPPEERFHINLAMGEEEFEEYPLCFQHDAGFVLCVDRRPLVDPDLYRNVSRGFLFGNGDELYFVDRGRRRNVPLTREGSDEYTGLEFAFSDSRLTEEQVNFDVDGVDDPDRTDHRGFNSTFLHVHRATDTLEAIATLHCGIVLEFSPLSEEESQQIVAESTIHWPIPALGFRGGKTSDGEIFVAILGRRAQHQGVLLYVGHPPELERVAAYRSYPNYQSLPDGRTLHFSRVSFSEIHHILDDGEKIYLKSLDREQWRRLFEEEIEEPQLPTQGLDEPRACELLENLANHEL